MKIVYELDSKKEIIFWKQHIRVKPPSLNNIYLPYNLYSFYLLRYR